MYEFTSGRRQSKSWYQIMHIKYLSTHKDVSCLFVMKSKESCEYTQRLLKEADVEYTVENKKGFYYVKVEKR